MQQHMAWEKKMREKHAHSALTRNNQPPLLYNDNLVVSPSNEWKVEIHTYVLFQLGLLIKYSINLDKIIHIRE